MDPSLQAAIRATNNNIRAIVRIQAYTAPYRHSFPYLGAPTGQGSGTGFIISLTQAAPGIVRATVMTAAHVVNSASKFTVRFPSLGAYEIEGHQLVLMPAFDLAVFNIVLDSNKTPALRNLRPHAVALATDEELNTLPQGTAVQAYGFPVALNNVKVTTGSFNGVERHELQHDAATSPGSSGGPVISTHLNAVIGVVSWKLNGRAVEGVQFTMPVSLWRLAVKRIKGRPDALTVTRSGVRIMKPPMFGFCVQKVTDDLTLAQSCTRPTELVELELERQRLGKQAADTVERILSPYDDADPKVWERLLQALHRVQRKQKERAQAAAPKPSLATATKPAQPRPSKSQLRGEAALKAVKQGFVARMRQHTERMLKKKADAARNPTRHAASVKRAAEAARVIRRDGSAGTNRRALTVWGGSVNACIGARVEDVVVGGAAFKAGLRVGDILGAFDGHPVNGRGEVEGVPWAQGQMVSVSELLFRAIEPRMYPVVVWRGAERKVLHMTAEPRSNSLEPLFPPFEMPSFIVLDGLVLVTSHAGLVTAGFSAPLSMMSRSKLNTKRCVVVVNVIRGSRAATHGSLKRGDIVRAISDRPVQTVKDVARIILPGLQHAFKTDDADAIVQIVGGAPPDRAVVFNTTYKHVLESAASMKRRMQTPSNVLRL